MTFGPSRQLANQLRAIPLEAVLQESQARRDPHDQHRWHTARGVLSVTGTKFMNWTCGRGGGGAIDLAMHLHGLGFSQAVQWLSQHFPLPASGLATPLTSKPALSIPSPDSAKLWRVEQYLIRERRIPPLIVQSLIESANLYADHRANAVFLLRGEHGIPVGAELRGTTSRSWHGLAPGSQKDHGFFSIPTSPLPTIILVESAIDAISCFALHPQHRCISTAGARPDPRWLLALLDKGYSVSCGFDADDTGETMGHAMLALYPSIQRLRPSHHDWNDVLRARA